MASPGPYVFIVRQEQPEVFSTLLEHFAHDRDVRVVWDRREGERRAASSAYAQERRRCDRRGPPPHSWLVQGYVLVPPSPET
ncbi:MAG: hypothetical protein ACRELA_20430 [Candidatus Rokuibacteriota bacterium]